MGVKRAIIEVGVSVCDWRWDICEFLWLLLKLLRNDSARRIVVKVLRSKGATVVKVLQVVHLQLTSLCGRFVLEKAENNNKHK